MGSFEYARLNPLPPVSPEPKQDLGREFDDEFNAGWEKGALPQDPPQVVLVRLVGGNDG